MTKSSFRVYDIKKKNISVIKIDDSEMFSIHSNKENKENKNINHYFSDVKNNCFYNMINNEKNEFQIEKILNVNLVFVDTENINIIDKINANLSINYDELKSCYPNKYYDD